MQKTSAKHGLRSVMGDDRREENGLRLLRPAIPLLLAAVFACTPALAQSPVDLEPKASQAAEIQISSVLLAKVTCGNGTSALMSRTPLEETIKAQKYVDVGEPSIRFHLRPHPDIATPTIRLAIDDRSRRVRDDYVLYSQGFFSEVTGAIVVTDASPANTQEQYFRVVRSLSAKFAAKNAMPFELGEMPGPNGMALELLVPGRSGSMCFPTADFRASTEAGVNSLGISRFIVLRGRLIEFSLVLRFDASVNLEVQKQRARLAMDDFWRAVE